MNKLLARWKFIVFVIIFFIIYSIYNLDNQTVNYILKRGVILEYSISKDTKINDDALKNKLFDLGIKYYNIDEIDKTKDEVVDSDNKIIEKTLLVTLPKKASNESISLFNNISDYIFENYNGSKLINLRTLNDIYSKRFSAFIKALEVLLTSFLIWTILLQIILKCSRKESFLLIMKNAVSSFFVDVKNNTINLFKNTKEKGILYLLRCLLIDENKDGKEPDYTKEIINTILFVILFVILIRFFIGELRWIPSGSMRPTILEKDRVFVEKLKYPDKAIERGDILVFYPPETELSNNPFKVFARLTGIFCKDIAFIKRVVGMPNDKFEIKQDTYTNEYRVYINDKPLNEPYISSKTEWTPCADEMYCGPFIIPNDSYFMMGDNRNNSQDSRFWGFLDKNRIIGRANFMFYPISRINILKDKYLYLHKQKQFNSIIEDNFILNRYEFL